MTSLDLSGNPLELSPLDENTLLSLPALQSLGLALASVDAAALDRLYQNAPGLRISTTPPSSEPDSEEHP